jgi:hypothetical protein
MRPQLLLLLLLLLLLDLDVRKKNKEKKVARRTPSRRRSRRTPCGIMYVLSYACRSAAQLTVRARRRTPASVAQWALLPAMHMSHSRNPLCAARTATGCG